jgi:drug/metabolite transporter superfamily protein YnfA
MQRPRGVLMPLCATVFGAALAAVSGAYAVDAADSVVEPVIGGVLALMVVGVVVRTCDSQAQARAWAAGGGALLVCSWVAAFAWSSDRGGADVSRAASVRENVQLLHELPASPGARSLGLTSYARRGDDGERVVGYVTVERYSVPATTRLQAVAVRCARALGPGWTGASTPSSGAVVLRRRASTVEIRLSGRGRTRLLTVAVAA